MKYAILADTHGNNFALQYVLADAKAQGVDKYLFLGDYAQGSSQNAVVETIRNTNPAVVIRGNGEGYFDAIRGKDSSELTDEQFKPVYWTYNALSAQNLDYLAALPETAVITDGGFEIHLAHAMGLFFRTPRLAAFHSREFRLRMDEKPFTHEEYLCYARSALLATPSVVDEIRGMDKGIYLFGHNHLQFHMEYEGRVFINPGSCGQPLDCDTRAPYTILTIDGNGYHVDERRVEYDVNLEINELDNCGFTEYASTWCQVQKFSLQTASDAFEPFVMHLVETAKKMGEHTQPVSNAAFNAAVATWNTASL